jgi:hypothetical protein
LPRSEAKAWVLVGAFNTPQVCGDGDTYEIKFPIPESLTGPTYHASAVLSLLKSKAAKGNYVLHGEAVLTPAGDFLVTFGHEFLFGEAVRVYA